jgi:hypothetical protein
MPASEIENRFVREMLSYEIESPVVILLGFLYPCLKIRVDFTVMHFCGFIKTFADMLERRQKDQTAGAAFNYLKAGIVSDASVPAFEFALLTKVTRALMGHVTARFP